MNSFIGKRLYLSAAVALILLLVFSCLSAVWQYHRIATQHISLYFKQGSETLKQSAVELEQIKSLLNHMGRQTNRYFLTPTAGNDKVNLQQSFISVADTVNNPSAQNKSTVFDAHSAFILQAIETVQQHHSIQSVTLLQQRDQFSFYAAHQGSMLPETATLQWILLREKYLRQHLNSPVAAPPVNTSSSENPSQTTKNYLLLPFELAGNMAFWLVELDLSALLFQPLATTAQQVVMWEPHSGVVLNSNLQRTATAAQNNIDLISDVLPSPLLRTTFNGEPSTEFYRETVLSVDDYIMQKSVLAGGLYSVIMYQPSQVWLMEVIAEALKLGFIVFVIGCLALFVFVRLIVWHLAIPTSRLIQHIESENADVLEGDYFAPEGWHNWFGRVQRLSQENKRLLSRLTDRNSALEDETRLQNRELLQQTVNKDRHIALNDALMNTIPDLLYYKNISGGYLGCNKAYEKYIGESEADLVTKIASDIYPPKRAAEIDQIERDIIARNQPYVEENWSKNANGDLLLLRWLYSPITSSSGEVLGILGLARDITEQQQSMNELSDAVKRAERADQIKGEFIANISHEIRTPMNSIIGMLQLLDDISDEPNQKSYIKIADSSAKSLLAVINNILDFSKASASKLALENEDFSLTDVMDSAFANVLPKALKKGLILDCSTPLNMLQYFSGDAIKLGQIFTNLLGNAVKFTDTGVVKLEVKPLEQNLDGQQLVQFKVIDTGIGIAQDMQSRVFEAFSQADNSVTRKYGGTGLGLTIVYQLVQLLKGTIEMTSRVGKGTEITVVLPLSIKDQQPQAIVNKSHWLYWDDTTVVDDILAQKLDSIAVEYERLELTEAFISQIPVGSILLCRSESLTQLPGSLITQIKAGRIKLQPVAFEIVDHNSALQGIPHLPILTAPFHAKSMLINLQTQNQVKSIQVQPSGDALSHIKVLVVEDNIVNQQVIKLMLLSEQADVTMTNDGQQALDYLQHNSVDIVVTDIQMPVMDGITLAENIRAEHTSQQLPIIAVSAHTTKEDADKSLAVGIDRHLAKPVDKKQLIAALVELCPAASDVSIAQLNDVVDMPFLMGQFSNSEEAVKKVLKRFYLTQNNSIQSLIRQYEDADFDSSRNTLHTIKGVLGGIGAKRAHQLSFELEQAIKEQRSNLVEVFNLWKHELTELLSRLAALK